jgi:hypothetical protein
MSNIIENVSSDLFNFLKNHFELGEIVDEDGNITFIPEDMKVFSFNFIDSKNNDCGCVVVSILDEDEFKKSVKVYYGQDLVDTNPTSQNEWYEFLQTIRQFAKMHMLGFDIRNINTGRLTKRDIEPMFESTFSPIDGTVKTSRQMLDGVELIIKHSENINPKIKNSRSRKIDRIYIGTPNGEKFLLPFTSIQAARAMARHAKMGGNPYDNIGVNICHLIDEHNLLRRFVRIMKNRNLSDSEAFAAVGAAKDRYMEIKKIITSIISDRGYNKNSESLHDLITDLEDTEDINLFSDIDMDDKMQMAMPHVIKAYQSRALYGLNEFEKWAMTTKNGEPLEKGEEIVTEADMPSAQGTFSPLTNPYVKIPKHFYNSKQIEKKKDTSGKMSPFSMLNSPEQKDEDDNVKRGNNGKR